MPPSLDADGWELESAVERHRRAPRTFSIPTAGERANLAVGSLVKLLFLILGRDETGSPYVQGERMWVVVEEVGDRPRYRGTLESRPRTAGAIQRGATVWFGPEHVAAVFIPRRDPCHPHHLRNHGAANRDDEQQGSAEC